MTDECGLLNLASCIPQKLYDFFLGIVNAPIQPLLDFTKSLLTEPVNLSLFGSIWAIIIYILSMFYGLLLLYTGFNFIISGYDVVKRERAKEWFRNILIMIVLVQMSYFIYATFIDMNSLMTYGVVNMIDSKFFLLTADNIVNLGLELFLGIFYMLTLIFTVLLLTLRYVVVAIGVVLIPVGIFLYFIPPIKEYGKLIINTLAVIMFITFFDSLILLAGAKIVQIPLFENFKIVVMITCFSIVNFLMFYIMIFSAIKSAVKTADSVISPFASIAKYFV
ncbi:Uncharacterised protein [uncultured archaeon]|nr:Uncharacterised protein [uncultured archaeon]